MVENLDNTESPAEGRGVSTTRLVDSWVIGKWTVSPPNGEMIHHDGRRVHLAPKHMDVLILLAQNAGNCVSRASIIEAAWRRSFVQDEVLTRVIADLRKTLADGTEGAPYITTVPKRGYRLAVAAHHLGDIVINRGPSMHAATASLEDSVAEQSPALDNEVAATDVPLHEAQMELPEATVSEPTQFGPKMPVAGQTRASRKFPLAVKLSLLMAAVALLLALIALIVSSRNTQAHKVGLLANALSAALPAVSSADIEMMPRWADEGHQFVYVRAVKDFTTTAIRMFDTRTRIDSVIVDESKVDLCPTPSPDGKTLAWTRLDGSGCSVMFMPLAGGPKKRAAECLNAQHHPVCLDFSSDGSSLFYTAPNVENPSVGTLVRLNLRDGSSSPALDVSGLPAGTVASPRVSPNGQHLMFEVRDALSESRVYLANLSSAGKAFAFLRGAHQNYGASWLPSSREVLLATDAVDQPGLVLQEVDDVASARFVGPRGARRPDVSHSGAVVFEQHQYQINLWLAAAGQAELRRLTDSSRHDAGPRFAPDGNRLLFNSNRSGLEAIWMHDFATDSQYPLALDSRTRWLRPAWGVDAGKLLVSRFDGKTYRICSVVWISGELECPNDLRGAVSAVPLASGAGYLKELLGDSGSELLTTDGKGSQSSVAQRVARWRSDGQSVVYSDIDGRLFVKELANDGEIPPASELGVTLGPNDLFALSGGRLYVFVSSALGASVFFSYLDSPGDLLATSFPLIPRGVRDFDVSPDGKLLVFEGPPNSTVDIHVAN